jgi:hypothetical protein
MVAGLAAYGVIATILLFRLNPKPVLIGIDPYGTRVIREGGDRLIRQEKENFLKHFLALQYSYDQATFQKRVSDCGDLMAEELWAQKKIEFERLSQQLKVEELTQTVEIKEVREIDSANFEADLVIHVKRRLNESSVKLRVDLKIHPNPRRENNPYPYEVERYDESQAS